MKRLLLVTVLLAGFVSAKSQLAPQSAAEILAEATQIAAKENKNVFVLFHASWCGWCHKMDTAMNDPAVKKYFTDNYVIRHLVVYESKGKENLENPGAIDMLTKYKGNDKGIPYWLVFDRNGVLLSDSKMRPEGGSMETGENTGCPASEKEVTHFVTTLKKTSRITDAQLEVIRKRFRLNEN
jgi:thiol-disulfide isomerase/thioredoxin